MSTRNIFRAALRTPHSQQVKCHGIFDITEFAQSFVDASIFDASNSVIMGRLNEDLKYAKITCAQIHESRRQSRMNEIKTNIIQLQDERLHRFELVHESGKCSVGDIVYTALNADSPVNEFTDSHHTGMISSITAKGYAIRWLRCDTNSTQGLEYFPDGLPSTFKVIPARVVNAMPETQKLVQLHWKRNVLLVSRVGVKLP